MEITRKRVLRVIQQPSCLITAGKRRMEEAHQRWRDYRAYAPPPRYITLFLTNRCNLRCRMCAQFGESGKSYELAHEQLPKDVVMRLVEELSPYGTHISLMGGEPSLYQGWLDIVHRIKAQGLTCDIITNGTLLKRDAEQIVKSGLDTVNVSLDGPEEIHDRIRGVPGTFAKVVGGLDYLLELRGDQPTPRVVLFYTITRHNYSGLVEFAQWAKQRHLDGIIYFHLRFFEPGDYQENALMMQAFFGGRADCQEGFVFDPGHIDTDVLIDQIQTLRSTQWGFNVQVQPDYPLEELPAYYHVKNYRRNTLTNCAIPWTNASIAPNCRVTPCLELACGDLRENSFLEIWNGSKFRKFRRVIRKVKRFPVCHRCCN